MLWTRKRAFSEASPEKRPYRTLLVAEIRSILGVHLTRWAASSLTRSDRTICENVCARYS